MISPTTQGLLNALTNLEREYETAVMNDVFSQTTQRAQQSSGQTSESQPLPRRRMAYRPPPTPQVPAPTAPLGGTSQVGPNGNESGHPLANSIVFNGNGVGFLADPNQLTALFNNFSPFTSANGNVNNVAGAGVPLGNLNYTLQTAFFPFQIDEAGNVFMDSTWENDHGVLTSAALSEEEIAQLATRPFSAFIAGESDQETTCSVCQHSFQNTDRTTRLGPCNHLFHADCIRPWLLRVDTCPMCRTRVEIPAPSALTGQGEAEDSDDIPEPPSP